MQGDLLRALVVDDTAIYRRILSESLEATGEVGYLATAPLGSLALERIERNPVDLVLLDLEMPEMDGIEVLVQIRQRWPDISVVMVSGSTTRAAEATVTALEAGALDFVRKPQGASAEASRAELLARLRPLLVHVRTRRHLRGTLSAEVRLPSQPQPAPAPPRFAPPPSRIAVVGIGVSTGGPNALGEVIPRLPADLGVPVLVVQHMPPLFTASLAEHLAKRSALPVREARDGEVILPGEVLIAPGGRHMVVRSRPAQAEIAAARIVGLNDQPPENSCRPSVDVLFRSMAAQYGGQLLAVVMTGMGSDGCEGIRAMKRQGCHCLTQTEATCVVYGMPASVDEAGLSDERVPLDRIAGRIAALVKRGPDA